MGFLIACSPAGHALADRGFLAPIGFPLFFLVSTAHILRLMQYPLYHAVPSNMVGSTLLPLSKLKEISPETYTHNLSKFPDQLSLIKQPVTPLDCTKEDVLFLTPLMPHLLEVEYARHTNYAASLAGTQLYQIDLADLDLNLAVLYISFDHGPASIMSAIDQSFLKNFAVYQSFPPAALDHWDTVSHNYPAGTPNSTHLFDGTAVILYKGSIDVTHSPVIIIEPHTPTPGSPNIVGIDDEDDTI